MRIKRRHKNAISLLLTAFLCVMGSTLSALDYRPDAPDTPNYLFYPDMDVQEYTAPAEVQGGEFDMTSPKDGEVVQLLTPIQREYLFIPHDERIAKYATAEFRQHLASEGSAPRSVTLSFTTTVPNIRQTRFVIAENQDFCHAVSVRVRPETPMSLELRNLKIATTYYWKVQLVTRDGLVESSPAHFTTEDLAPRLMDIDNVRNIRDFGGRIGLGGKRVRQGMIYRSNGLNTNSVVIPMAQEKVFQKYPELKAVYDDYQRKIGKLEEELKNPPVVKVVPFTIHDNWSVFVPDGTVSHDDSYAFAALTEIPSSYLGAQARVVRPDKKHLIELGEPSERKPGFLMTTIEAEDDGFIQLGCAGDWYWYLAINGTILYDCVKAGNGHSVNMERNILEIPVKKGKNILSVFVQSGSLGFRFGYVKFDAIFDHAILLQQKIAELQRMCTKATSKKEKRLPPNERLSDYMVDYMAHTLGIRSDLDLRGGGETSGMTGSPLGESATWFLRPTIAYNGMGAKAGKEAFAKAFRVFLDEKNYPIDFHCISGQDRTGSVAFVMHALLGVKLEEIYLDWEVTGYRNTSTDFNHKLLFNRLIEVFDEIPGKDYTAKAENYFLSIGFTREDIEKFRSIMLE